MLEIERQIFNSRGTGAFMGVVREFDCKPHLILMNSPKAKQVQCPDNNRSSPTLSCPIHVTCYWTQFLIVSLFWWLWWLLGAKQSYSTTICPQHFTPPSQSVLRLKKWNPVLYTCYCSSWWCITQVYWSKLSLVIPIIYKRVQKHSSEKRRCKSQAINVSSWVGQMHTVQLPSCFGFPPSAIWIEDCHNIDLTHKVFSHQTQMYKLNSSLLFCGQKAVVR